MRGSGHAGHRLKRAGRTQPLFDRSPHLVLWAAGASWKLSGDARTLLERADQQRWFSAASLWEIAIKSALGRADFVVEPRRLRRGLLDNGWQELAVSGEHAAAALDLPPLHNDPFDRLLLAQAHVEGLTLLTADAMVAQYPVNVRKV